jgi:hypothetical protein
MVIKIITNKGSCAAILMVHTTMALYMKQAPCRDTNMMYRMAAQQRHNTSYTKTKVASPASYQVTDSDTWPAQCGCTTDVLQYVEM